MIDLLSKPLHWVQLGKAKEFAMSSFVIPHFPTRHPGLERLARFARWTAPLRKSLVQTYSRWQATRQAAAHDARLWEHALQDARVMADISAAMNRRIAK